MATTTGERPKPTHRRKGGNFREMVSRCFKCMVTGFFRVLWEWGICAKILQELMHENSLITHTCIDSV